MFRALRALTSRRFYQYLLFLLIPGISLKRWLGVGAIGLALSLPKSNGLRCFVQHNRHLASAFFAYAHVRTLGLIRYYRGDVDFNQPFRTPQCRNYQTGRHWIYAPQPTAHYGVNRITIINVSNVNHDFAHFL